MKEEKKKNIKEIAKQILELEYSLSCGLASNSSETMAKMEQICQELSLEDMLEIDNYIMEKLLTK